MKTSLQCPVIGKIEQAISDTRFGRNENPVIFKDAEVQELASTGEFELRAGTNHTVGSRIPANVGLAYSHKVGLVVANSQEVADSIAKEIPLDRILAYAGIILTVSFS